MKCHHGWMPPAKPSIIHIRASAAGFASGTTPDPSYHWWDLRLHPSLGTIEVRICDTQTEIPETVALVALVQTLTAWLTERYDAGERLPVHDRDRIAESLEIGIASGRGVILRKGERYERPADAA